MNKNKALFMAQAGMIAAVYIVLTIFVSAFGLASGNIQIRISEALCVLPAFTQAAVPGLFIGCLLSNLLTGAAVYDIVFGSLATLIGALGTRYLRKHRFLCTLPPVISNAIIIPLVLRFGYGFTFEWHGADWSVPFFALTVGIGEIISVCAFGGLLITVLDKNRQYFFKQV